MKTKSYDIELLHDVDKDFEAEFYHYSKTLSYSKGASPFSVDDLLKHFYILIEGRVKTYQINFDNAKEQTIFIYKRGVNFFNDFLSSLDENIGSDALVDFKPAVNTREGKDAYHIDVDLPGVKKEDNSVDVENNMLTISGKRETKSEVKEEDYYRVEKRLL